MIRWAAEPERRTQWANVFSIDERLLSSVAFICTRHFTDDQYTLYERSSGIVVVRPNIDATPTIVIEKQFGVFKF
jgi:hypothetical protein